MAAPLAPVDGQPPIVLVLLDRAGKRLVVIGPFDTAADAGAWQPEPAPEHYVERIMLALT